MTQQYQAPPPYPQAPPPTPKKSWFARHKIMTVLGALLLVIVVASIASSGGGTDTATTTPPAGAQDSPAASQQPQPQSPPAQADEPTNKFPMQDGDWRLDTLRLKDDGLGDFGGTARITYTGDDQNGGDNMFTITVFKNGQEIATLDGAANTVMPGKTVSVQLLSTDKYVKGPYTFDFQNNL